ncbi:hypothetical protein IQ250_05120 [Pseudanabaenaceae cyanobacterium LEGE 13415]|nr:hypothetical protein [Pseudanabaenaceae cyanobacterium LEGE 13415]
MSQRQRQASSFALSPDFIKLDERDLADALVFAYRLSQSVHYYHPDQVAAAGNWVTFFTNSTPVQIALISKTRPQPVKDNYDRKLQDFLETPSGKTLSTILDVWKYQLLDAIATWDKRLEPYTPLKSVIQGLVKTNLIEPLIRMQEFEKISGNSPTDFYRKFATQFKLDLTTRRTSVWRLADRESSDRAELDAVFQALFQTYRQIIQDAPNYLSTSLSDRQDLQPHLALFFAFWEVMRPAQDDLNRMTQRHLDFFYRRVLGLNARDAEPDHAHLLFELAKLPTLTEFEVPAGTRFKAGKDAIGKELFYKLDQAIVVHKAKIASVKGLFLEREDQSIRGLYASAIANSFDGKGGAFPKEQLVKSWLPFGNRFRDVVSLGLAIASDVLLLKEGDRTITLTLMLQETTPDSTPNLSSLSNSELQKLFKIKVSGKEKDWTEAELLSITRTALPNSIEQLTLKINLSAKQSPLLPYRADLPGAVLSTNKPVLLLLLNSNPADRLDNLAPYQFLRSLQLIDLKLEIIVDRVRDLVIQNDVAVQDANKPFLPFGSQPKPGNNLYIGSQEVFQKHLTALKIDLKLEQPKPDDWLKIYAAYDSAEDDTNPNQVNPNFDPGRLTIQALHGRTWSSVSVSSNLLNDSGITLTTDLTNLQLDAAIDSHLIEPWNSQTQDSFLRLQLAEDTPRSDFLHNEYPTVLARQMVAVATTSVVDKDNKRAIIGAYYRKPDRTIEKATTSQTSKDNEAIIPKEPYLPVVQSLSISYSAIAQKQDCSLFHLYPFDGFAELKPESNSFLAKFTEFEGELLIGLQDLDPPTALPLLFQVVEDSADPALEKTKVEWFYLEDNTWISLRDRIVSDTTNGLVASGIVQLAIPEKISRTGTTILDPSLYWLKVRVTERSRAICEIINVHTQAAQVSFTDEENDPNHLASPLAAGSIAKFEVAEPEIKTVEQPYTSFGGKLKEFPDHFYLRVSEQLRHKGRAVTIFDYERLVLEKFPEIYKVRCINHGLLDETQDQMYELVPGALTLAVVPDLSKRPYDLEPKVNINLRDKIREYIASLSSPWAEIKVVNARYEKVQIECRVKFKSPYDANFGYYSRKLNQAITSFLAPWTSDAQAEIQFGGRLYYSAALDFIEQQDYVDYIIDFAMNLEGEVNLREAIASSPRSVLTSGASTPTQLFHKILEFKEDTPLDNQRLPQPNQLGYKALEELTLD